LNKQMSVMERYRREVYRIGWRLQYQVKKIRKHECASLDAYQAGAVIAEDPDTRIWFHQLMSVLPAQGRKVLHNLYIQEMTEAETAAQLHMSQQAVNKWKRKMLRQLSQIVNL